MFAFKATSALNSFYSRALFSYNLFVCFLCHSAQTASDMDQDKNSEVCTFIFMSVMSVEDMVMAAVFDICH